MRYLAPLAFLPTIVVAQPSPAPISDVQYTITFDSAAAANRIVRVEMRFVAGGAEPVVLAMPRWTPGAYELSEFARYVRRFEASGSTGQELSWRKSDPHRWLIEIGVAGQVTVRYEVLADSLDSSMAWTRSDVAMLNGTALFMYPAAVSAGTAGAAAGSHAGATLDFPSRVRVVTRSEWHVATAMSSAAHREYTAEDYHELVDAPFLIGRFDLDSARVVQRWFRFATYPAGSVAGAARAQTWEQIRRMVPPMVLVFREVPFESYTILQVADESFGGASGLEHANSHLNVISPFAIGHPFLPSLYAHEIFHAWNVKRLRPADLWPYDYDRPQHTGLLWISEGVTDYYADLALVRGGVMTRSGFLQTTADKAQEVMNAPPVALEDASRSTWIRPADGTALVYYPKGSLVGLLLDIQLRHATGNRASLDSAMRVLYTTTYKTGRGFTDDDWWSTLESVAGGPSLDDFRRRYVSGRELLPYERLLPLAGLRMVTDTIREPAVGVRTLIESDGVLVTLVEPGGAAAEAGVQPGDYLLSVGGLRVTDRDFPERFRQGWAHREGTPLVMRVRRAGGEIDLRGTVRLVTRYALRVEEDRNATPAAVRIREGLLRGVVAP